MRFRQEKLLRNDLLICDGAIACMLGALNFFLDLTFWIWLVMLPLILCTIGLTCISVKYITIDEQGIRCESKKGILWNYRWGELVELRRASHNRYRAVYAVAREGSVQYKDQFNPVDAYFHLGREAKKALEAYCPLDIV